MGAGWARLCVRICRPLRSGVARLVGVVRAWRYTSRTMAADAAELRVEPCAGSWALAGAGAGEVELVNDFLGYLSDRNYSPRTVRAYAFDLLHFARWLSAEGLALDRADTDALLRYLAACRTAVLPHQRGGNVYSSETAATSATRRGRSTGA
jgi:Phage integrase, N-terminal SAM-like domain